jgi:formiminotetrahydrofolate cyclodeaminase
MPPLTSRPLTDFLDAIASSEPVPAGGSASALAGASGVSLLLMVAALPKTKRGTPDEATELAAAAARLRPLRDALVALVDRDAESYADVIAALRAPKHTESDRARRHEGVAAAMRRATEVLLETMRASRKALGLAVAVARCGSKSADADVNTAIELLLAAMRGAAGSVDANLAVLEGDRAAGRIAAERLQLVDEGTREAERARAGV